jgi:hypothetical protein
MAKTSPHQPLLLRLLHGAMVVLVPLAWLSGAVVFSNHDGRWLRLPLQVPGNWIDIHGTIGVLLWPLAALFVIYALSVGRFRLRHGSNAAALIGLVLAVGSGKFMQEDWLRNGDLDHFIYNLHVLAWLLIAAAVAWHIQGVVSRGGFALASSMFRLKTVKGSSR